jgi:hypothetical protein
MTWAGMSASSLVLRVAARSISVRTPNPWSASADRVASSVGAKGWFTVVLRA